MNGNRIVVGIDGSAGARAAALWAADECRVRGLSLLILHSTDAGGAALVAAPDDPWLRALDADGEQLLRKHVAGASARQPSVAVTSVLSQGRAADALIDLSATAELVVVGTQGRGGIIASVLGSVSHRVAAHAHCPVAVVPERPALRGGLLSPRVVVGVSPTVSGRLALDFAMAEAQRRDATVVAVRAWGEPDSSLVRELDRYTVERWRQRAGALLRDDLASSVERYPQVAIVPKLVNAEPAHALLRAARDAALVVVGCHHSEDRWSTRLGPVPAAILHRAPCPVVVVGARRPATVAGGEGVFVANFS